MALKLTANCPKRLGLPGFSSHQFSVSVETEIISVEDVGAESARLKETLQRSVDEQIQQTEFVSDADYGSNGNGHQPVNRIKINGIKPKGNGEGWHCSDKQRELILKLIADHNLEEVAKDMSQEIFGCSPDGLNKLQAGGLIPSASWRSTRARSPSRARTVAAGLSGHSSTATQKSSRAVCPSCRSEPRCCTACSTPKWAGGRISAKRASGHESRSMRVWAEKAPTRWSWELFQVPTHPGNAMSGTKMDSFKTKHAVLIE